MQNNILAKLLFENNLLDESIYNFSILLEDRLDFIKKAHGGKLDSVVDTLAQNQDPTKNKKYTEWLVNRHLKGDNVWAPEVKAGLEHFDKAKSTAHDTNIKNHTVESMLDVAHMVRSTSGTPDVKPLEKQYESEGVTGYKIPNKETSVHVYGHGREHSTNWCTAANSNMNMFDNYEGGKYTMHFPNKAFLQFHHQSHQCKDPKDVEIDFHSDERYKPYIEHVNKFMHQTAKEEGGDKTLPHSHFGVDRDTFTEAWKNHKSETNALHTFTTNVAHHPLTDEQYHDAIESGAKHAVASNPQLTDSQVHSSLTTHFSPRIFSNPALKGKVLDTAVHEMLHGSLKQHAAKLGRLKNIQPHHVDDLLTERENESSFDEHGRNLDDATFSIADSGYYKFNDAQMRRVHELPGGKNVIAHSVGQHQTLPEDLRKSAIGRIDYDVRNGFTAPSIKKFAEHNDVHEHEYDKLVDAVADRKTVDHKFIGDMYGSRGIKKEHTDRLTHSLVGRNLSDRFILNPNVPHSHIAHLLHNYNGIGEYEISKYANRGDAKATVVDALNKKMGDEGGTSLGNDELHHIGYFKMKDMPKERFKDPESAPFVAMNLEHHPKATKEDLHDVINGLQSWSNKHKATISSKMTNGIINHPNSNPSHIHRLLDHWGHDWIVRNAVMDSSKSPPSVNRRIENDNFWQPEN